MERLKPCPFCGGEAKIAEKDFVKNFVRYSLWTAVCQKCGMQTRLKFSDEDAAIAWNRRVNEDAN